MLAPLLVVDEMPEPPAPDTVCADALTAAVNATGHGTILASARRSHMVHLLVRR
jgi:hypothetical protein